MKKKIIYLIIILTIIFFVCAVLLLKINSKLQKTKLEIIDATYKCNNIIEKFYEDAKYEYYFPCQKSSSMYVKLENGNKMLIIDALEEKKITIENLIDSDLEIIKKNK